ncbi:hypothetical protein PILCRDRAFT_681564 [Piloderma croceum F 1598]|uniref:Uncharacterized protein n=1 Tax=Piloderma croceum (strain F 1598) TaxID=765440 RepID=A0A0C3F5B0_PILCF|nr:hypothetical protein PILCRDRAFT_681564 [Piloderma croceum F 1598]
MEGRGGFVGWDIFVPIVLMMLNMMVYKAKNISHRMIRIIKNGTGRRELTLLALHPPSLGCCSRECYDWKSRGCMRGEDVDEDSEELAAEAELVEEGSHDPAWRKEDSDRRS